MVAAVMSGRDSFVLGVAMAAVVVLTLIAG